MSAITPVVAPLSPSGSPLDRVDQLTRSPRPDATWWVAVVETLDRLEERILEHRSHRRGLSRQLAFDAPHLAQRASSMDDELDGVRQRLRDVRGVAGRQAGDPGAVGEVSQLAADLARMLRRWERRASDLLHNAYLVDHGGE